MNNGESMIHDILAAISHWAVEVIATTGYFGVFILMALESCGVPIPSEVIMPFAGFLVAEGRLNAMGVMAAGAVGNVAGSWAAYYIGLKGGRSMIERYGKYLLIAPADVARAQVWFEKYGERSVFIGRCLPVVRTFISFPAGFAAMDLRRFLIYTTLGVIPWCIAFTYVGMYMGARWEELHVYVQKLDWVIVGVGGIGLVWFVAHHVHGAWGKKSHGDSTDTLAG